jgi:hypothetical protein
MKTYQKILLLWGLLLCGFGFALLFFEHDSFPDGRLLNVFVQVLASIISFLLVVKEPIRKNKFLFLNFFLFFFLLSVFGILYPFIAHFLSKANPYFSFYVAQYGNMALYSFLSLAIVYVVLDSLFREVNIFMKYVATLAVVCGFAGMYFYNFMIDPKYSYSTKDIKDFVVVSNAYAEIASSTDAKPTASKIAEKISLSAWEDNVQVGHLDAEHNLERIRKLYNYIQGDNYLILLWKPIYMALIKMNILSGFFILLFFGYQYKKDPPQGAFIDKIMFLFLVNCSLDILHFWSYINAVERQDMLQVIEVGQYVTIGVLLFIALFFAARLRFVSSVAGEFYESELVHNAQHITRWRDWIDNLIVYHFFNPKAVRGAFFSQRNPSAN